MRKWSEVDLSERIEGEHIFCIGMVVDGRKWIVCRWCQQFKHQVENRSCSGPPIIHLN